MIKHFIETYCQYILSASLLSLTICSVLLGSSELRIFNILCFIVNIFNVITLNREYNLRKKHKELMLNNLITTIKTLETTEEIDSIFCDNFLKAFKSINLFKEFEFLVNSKLILFIKFSNFLEVKDIKPSCFYYSGNIYMKCAVKPTGSCNDCSDYRRGEKYSFEDFLKDLEFN